MYTPSKQKYNLTRLLLKIEVSGAVARRVGVGGGGAWGGGEEICMEFEIKIYQSILNVANQSILNVATFVV